MTPHLRITLNLHAPGFWRDSIRSHRPRYARTLWGARISAWFAELPAMPTRPEL